MPRAHDIAKLKPLKALDQHSNGEDDSSLSEDDSPRSTRSDLVAGSPPNDTESEDEDSDNEDQGKPNHYLTNDLHRDMRPFLQALELLTDKAIQGSYLEKTQRDN